MFTVSPRAPESRPQEQSTAPPTPSAADRSMAMKRRPAVGSIMATSRPSRRQSGWYTRPDQGTAHLYLRTRNAGLTGTDLSTIDPIQRLDKRLVQRLDTEDSRSRGSVQWTVGPPGVYTVDSLYRHGSIWV